MKLPDFIQMWGKGHPLHARRFHRMVMALKAMQLSLGFDGATKPHPRERGLVAEKRKDKGGKEVTRWIRPPSAAPDANAKPKGKGRSLLPAVVHDLFDVLPKGRLHTPAFKSRFAARQWAASAPAGTEIRTPAGTYRKGDAGWAHDGAGGIHDDAWAASTLHANDATVLAAEDVLPPSSAPPTKPFQAHPAALEEAGFKRWTTEGGHDRWYAPDGLLEEIYGIKTSRYGTGNISSASLDGSAISNAVAGKILAGLGGLRLHWDAKEGRWGSGRGDPVNPNGEYSRHLIPELEAGLSIRGASLPAPVPEKQLYVQVPTFPTDGTADDIAEWGYTSKPGTLVEMSGGAIPATFKKQQTGWDGPDGRMKLSQVGDAIHDHISMFGPQSVRIHAPKSHPTANEHHTTEPMVAMAPAPGLTDEVLTDRREAIGQRKAQEAAAAEQTAAAAKVAAEKARVAAVEAAERAKVQAAAAAEAAKQAETDKIMSRLASLPPALQPESIKGRSVRISDPLGLPRGSSVTYRFKDEIKAAGGTYSDGIWTLPVARSGAKTDGQVALAHKLYAHGAVVTPHGEIAQPKPRTAAKPKAPAEPVLEPGATMAPPIESLPDTPTTVKWSPGGHGNAFARVEPLPGGGHQAKWHVGVDGGAAKTKREKSVAVTAASSGGRWSLHLLAGARPHVVEGEGDLNAAVRAATEYLPHYARSLSEESWAPHSIRVGGVAHQLYSEGAKGLLGRIFGGGRAPAPSPRPLHPAVVQVGGAHPHTRTMMVRDGEQGATAPQAPSSQAAPDRTGGREASAQPTATASPASWGTPAVLPNAPFALQRPGAPSNPHGQGGGIGDHVRAGHQAARDALNKVEMARNPAFAQHMASTATRRAKSQAESDVRYRRNEHSLPMGMRGKTPAQMVAFHHAAAGGLLEHEAHAQLATGGHAARIAHAHARAANEWAHVDDAESRSAAVARTAAARRAEPGPFGL